MKKILKLKSFKKMLELKYCILESKISFMLTEAELNQSGFKCYSCIILNNDFELKRNNIINDTLKIFYFLNNIIEDKNINEHQEYYLIIKNSIHINISKIYHFDDEFLYALIEVYIHDENLSNLLNMLDESELLLNIENKEENKKTKRRL